MGREQPLRLARAYVFCQGCPLEGRVRGEGEQRWIDDGAAHYQHRRRDEGSSAGARGRGRVEHPRRQRQQDALLAEPQVRDACEQVAAWVPGAVLGHEGGLRQHAREPRAQHDLHPLARLWQGRGQRGHEHGRGHTHPCAGQHVGHQAWRRVVAAAVLRRQARLALGRLVQQGAQGCVGDQGSALALEPGSRIEEVGWAEEEDEELLLLLLLLALLLLLLLLLILPPPP
eukprot:3041060-Pyramimonas_sp.AAC.1